MRILAVRGQNLASLAAKFDVDFEAEPIRSSGIFAITGPTGAGKTTLLDAMCLALFDRLPRVDAAEKGPSVGRVGGDGTQQVSYDDVRAILRHGTGSGYAEVDFVGQDGHRYRSHWEVKRAHGKASGKLQHQKMTLTEVDSGTVIGEKKTDTLQQIQKRIGLSFDQFCRSVLLAQGDFDTFLKAASKDRAALLERITGTEIYSRISQAAFARAKREREVLHDLDTQLGEHQPLGDDERAAAEARLTSAKGEVASIEAEKQFLAEVKDWWDVKAHLDRKVAEGEQVLGRAQDCNIAAEPDRVTLVNAKKALSLKSELDVASTAAAQLAEAEAALSAAETAEVVATDACGEARSASASAKTDCDAKHAAYDALGPQLDKAQRLDAIIDEAKKAFAKLQEKLEKSTLEKDASDKAFRLGEEELRAAREQREADGLWLEGHKATEAVALRFEDVAKGLSERVELEKQVQSSTRELETLKEKVVGSTSAREIKEREGAALEARETGLTAEITRLLKIVGEADRTTIETKRDAILRLQAAVSGAKSAANDAANALKGVESSDVEIATQEGIIRNSRASALDIDAELPAVTARLDEAKRNLSLSEAAGDEAAEHLRLILVDGEPCPVCGATEHPTTEVDRLLKARADTDRLRVNDLEKRAAGLQTNRALAEARISAAEAAVPTFVGSRSACEASLSEARQRWSATVEVMYSDCMVIGVEPPSLNDDAADAKSASPLVPFNGTLNELLMEAKRLLGQTSEADARAKELSGEREKVLVNLKAASAAVMWLKDEEQLDIAKQMASRMSLDERKRAHMAKTSDLDAILMHAFPGWKERVAASSSRFAKLCRESVDNWQDCKKRIDASDTAIATLRLNLERDRTVLAAKAGAAREGAELLATEKEKLDRWTLERRGLIGGRPVGEVRTEYRKRWEAADKKLNQLEAARDQAEKSAAAATAKVDAVRGAATAALLGRDSAVRRLAGRLDACQISRVQAEAAIARGEAWVAVEQARLDGLLAAVETARATLTERKRAAQEHEDSGRPEQTPDQLATRLAGVEERQKKVSEEFLTASAILLNDDQARTQLMKIKAELDEHRESARVWAQLDELIGSADGSKFRRYAQSLTFSHLIHFANRHLADLRPRYELQRAPGGDLALQVVDRDMADEVRGVHNLSGGEKFLVSLALALGLASISSNRGIKVESLFIDEGFGSLDSSSLAMAISVLEQLQATGRRVAVISHVDELKERIGVRVEVTSVGGGRSTLQIVSS